jgi:hypothetical protein
MECPAKLSGSSLPRAAYLNDVLGWMIQRTALSTQKL